MGQLRVDLVIRVLEAKASTSPKASAYTATCVLCGRLFLDISLWQGCVDKETICFLQTCKQSRGDVHPPHGRCIWDDALYETLFVNSVVTFFNQKKTKPL